MIGPDLSWGPVLTFAGKKKGPKAEALGPNLACLSGYAIWADFSGKAFLAFPGLFVRRGAIVCALRNACAACHTKARSFQGWQRRLSLGRPLRLRLRLPIGFPLDQSPIISHLAFSNAPAAIQKLAGKFQSSSQSPMASITKP